MNLLLKLKQFVHNLVSYNPFDSGYVEYLLYLYSSEALPQALTDEEEKSLILKLNEHEDYAKQKLIEHNLRLVVYISKKFENNDVEIEDLISVGSIGLIKAINSYKPDKNIKIATYASKCIENEILMHLRKISKQRKEISLSESLNVDSDGNELLISDIVPNDDEGPEGDLLVSLEKQILWRVLSTLTRREQLIMNLRFGLKGNPELTQKEVAEKLGISQSYISRLEKKIVSRMKKEMAKEL